jgi:DNA-binding CsgD family transcriptional regulator
MQALAEKRVENLGIRDGYSVEEFALAVERLARHQSRLVKRIALNELLLMASAKPSVANKVLKCLAKSESRPARELVSNIKLAMKESLLTCQWANKRERLGKAARVFARELARTSQQNYIIWYLEGLLALRNRIGEGLNPEGKLAYLLEASRFVFIMRESIDSIIGSLTDRERQIMKCRFGLGLPGSMTITETARLLRWSPTTIRHIEAKALRKLRHPSRSRRMRYYITSALKRGVCAPECALLAAVFGEPLAPTRFEFKL